MTKTQAEIVTSVRQRRRWSRAEKERIVAAAMEPGAVDPPPLKWSDLRYVFDIKEDCNGKEAIQA